MWLSFPFSFFPTAVFQSDRWPGQAVWTVLSRNDLLLWQTLFYILFPNKDPQMDVFWWCSCQGGRNIQTLLKVFGDCNKKLRIISCLLFFSVYFHNFAVCLPIYLLNLRECQSYLLQVDGKFLKDRIDIFSVVFSESSHHAVSTGLCL